MDWRSSLPYLIVAYVFGAVFILLIAIPIGILIGLYENNYIQMLEKTMLAYLLGIIGIAVGLELGDRIG